MANLSDTLKDFKYFTWKHNPLTRLLFELYANRNSKRLEKVIFTATTGRSGTKYLVNLFSNLEDCVAYHEPHPVMCGKKILNRNFPDDTYSKFVYWYIKSINIKRFTEGQKYYFEANHCFIKSFHDYVIDEFKDKVIVIHLHRDPVKVANSINAIGNHPGTADGNHWWLDYKYENNIIKIPEILDEDEYFSHSFFKCLWYWYEVESRIIFWKNMYPTIPFIDLRTEDLFDKDKIHGLLKEIGMPESTYTNSLIHKEKVHKKLDQKINNPLEADKAQSMHDDFIKLLKLKGYL